MWKPETSARLLVALVGFAGAIFLPWWIPALSILILALFWRAWEGMVIGLFVDFLWLPAHALPLFTLGSILAVWLLEPLRSEFLSR